jgi:hypothetical protein
MQDLPYAAAWPARKAHECTRKFGIVNPSLRLKLARVLEHGRVMV